jgi:hypothetical protein
MRKHGVTGAASISLAYKKGGRGVGHRISRRGEGGGGGVLSSYPLSWPSNPSLPHRVPSESPTESPTPVPTATPTESPTGVYRQGGGGGGRGGGWGEVCRMGVRVFTMTGVPFIFRSCKKKYKVTQHQGCGCGGFLSSYLPSWP